MRSNLSSTNILQDFTDSVKTLKICLIYYLLLQYLLKLSEYKTSFFIIYLKCKTMLQDSQRMFISLTVPQMLDYIVSILIDGCNV